MVSRIRASRNRRLRRLGVPEVRLGRQEMRMRGLAMATVAVLSLAVSGCSDAPTQPKVEIVDASPVVDDPQAREALKQSLNFISTTSFETYLNMGPQVDAAGYMDAPHKL